MFYFGVAIYFALLFLIGTTTELKNLVKFWTGWEILPTSFSVEIVKGRYPTAATCYETLRIPGHYKDYISFKSDIHACISTSNTGFGPVCSQGYVTLRILL